MNSLQKVIDEQKDEVKKANERATSAATASGGAAAEEVDRLTKDLAKAKDELKESAIEKERCQSQLEMLVQELEQKQVGNRRRDLFLACECFSARHGLKECGIST